MEILFWISVGLIVYTYAGYPLLLFILSKIRNRPVEQDDSLPAITLIIPFYNEEARVADKLENTRKLEYPREQIQIIAVSDTIFQTLISAFRS